MKSLTAKQILAAMPRATPANALKLADPNEYLKVPYENFIVEVDSNPNLNQKIKDQLHRLCLDITLFNSNADKFHFHTDKIYEFFILRLQEIFSV